MMTMICHKVGGICEASPMYTMQAEKVGNWCIVLFRGIDRWFRQLEIQRKCAEFGRLMDVDYIE